MDSVIVSLMLLGGISSSGEMPFWATANRYGVMPEGNGAFGLLCARKDFDASRCWQWRAGVSLAGNFDSSRPGFRPMVDEAYAGLRWKVLTLDVGMRHRDADFLSDGGLGSLSVTGGSVVWSGNARTMPGYTLVLTPWELVHNRLWLEGAFGDYATYDDRYVSGALVHNTRIGLTVGVTPRFRIGVHLDHYAMWAGTSPEYGKMPASFSNYMRMLFGRPGKSGWRGDEVNVLGNHLGGEKFRFEYLGEGWKAVFQHDIPYDDGSGMGFQNFPDGVNTLCFSFDRKDRWVSDILYEFTSTMSQSGPRHDMVDEDGKRHILGGNDDYFNNEFYRSGWTHVGKILGLPIFMPLAGGSPLTAMGICSNRILSHHFAISGKLFRKAPYKLMLTQVSHYGTYDAPFKDAPRQQFSLALDGYVPFNLARKHTVSIRYGIYADAGDALHPSAGALLGISYVFY